MDRIQASSAAQPTIFNRLIVPYTKTALIGISVLGTAYATYFNPFYTAFSLIGTLSIGGFTLSKSLNSHSPETIKKVIQKC